MNRIRSFIPFSFILIAFVYGVGIGDLLLEQTKIDQLLVVKAIGIDISENEAGRFELTMAYSQPEETPKNSIITASGESFSSALNAASTYAGRNVYLGHANLIVVGKTAAQNGLSELLDFITRGNETRLNADIITAYGRAQDVLKVSPTSGADVLSELQIILKSTSKNSYSYRSTLGEIIADTADKYRFPVTPLIFTKSEKDMPIGNVLIGCAVYKGDKLLTELTGEDAYFFTLLRNKANSHTFCSKTENAGLVTSQVNSSQTGYGFSVTDTGKIRVKVSADLRSVVVESSTGDFNDEAAKEVTQDLKKNCEDGIKKITDQILKLGEDILNISDKLRRSHGEIFIKYTGADQFEFDVDVLVLLENSTIYGGG